MAEGSDFDDDENFGLGEPLQYEAAAPAVAAEPSVGVEKEATSGSAAGETNAAPPVKDTEDDDDIYADIAGQSAIVPFETSATPPVSTGEAEEQHLDRQNSGNLAESQSERPGQTKGGRSAPGVQRSLPKRLADTTVVYVGELHWWTTDADLQQACQECGSIEDIIFFEDKASGKSKGYALVKFRSKEAANLCRLQMHGMEINGRKCVVTFSSNSNAATAAAKGGGKTDNSRSTTPPFGSGPGRGHQGGGRARGGRGWGGPPQQDMPMPMPPMPPWGGHPMMGMAGMRGLPLPAMGMPPFMNMMNSQRMGGDNQDFNKRKRY